MSVNYHQMSNDLLLLSASFHILLKLYVRYLVFFFVFILLWLDMQHIHCQEMNGRLCAEIFDSL